MKTTTGATAAATPNPDYRPDPTHVARYVETIRFAGAHETYAVQFLDEHLRNIVDGNIPVDEGLRRALAVLDALDQVETEHAERLAVAR